MYNNITKSMNNNSYNDMFYMYNNITKSMNNNSYNDMFYIQYTCIII